MNVIDIDDVIISLLAKEMLVGDIVRCIIGIVASDLQISDIKERAGSGGSF